MPRKTKDKSAEDLEIVTTEKATKKSASKGSTSKKVATKTEKTASKKVVEKAKKTATKKTVKKTEEISTPKATTKNSKKVATTDTKKSAKKRTASKKSTSKSTSTKKATAKKVAAKNDTSNKTSNKKSTKSATTTRKKQSTVVEYYDLPNHYEQTIVKILAQTPTILFVYWNISDKDIKKLLKQYGENFFQETYPILLVINKTKNYQFEVEINDYANSWYLHIPDSDCEYEVILMRKNKNYQAENTVVSITSSNQLETPNDHILFEKLGKTVFFQDVKTKNVQEKNISSFAFMHNVGRIYNIYDLYKEIYKDELNGDELSSRLQSS